MKINESINPKNEGDSKKQNNQTTIASAGVVNNIISTNSLGPSSSVVLSASMIEIKAQEGATRFISPSIIEDQNKFDAVPGSQIT